MIKVSVLYPATDGARFDHDYYRDKHVPLAKEAFGDGVKRVEIDRGIDAMGPAPFVAAAHFWFDSQEAVQAAMAGAGSLIADVPNYTDIQPQLVVSEVVEG